MSMGCIVWLSLQKYVQNTNNTVLNLVLLVFVTCNIFFFGWCPVEINGSGTDYLISRVTTCGIEVRNT